MTSSPHDAEPLSRPGSPGLQVGETDADLDNRLTTELTAFNVAASGHDDQRDLTVKATDAAGDVLAGLSGWTWGTCAGVSMLWVRADQRGQRWGSRMLAAAEEEARRRGCTQVVLSSFTFQAPGFYQRHGYTETGRTTGLPVAGHADVHLRKDL